MKGKKKRRYNIEITLDCKTCQDAKDLGDYIMYSGFIPIIEDTIITVIAKNVDSVALDYLTKSIEEDDRIIGASFHRTLF